MHAQTFASMGVARGSPPPAGDQAHRSMYIGVYIYIYIYVYIRSIYTPCLYLYAKWKPVFCLSKEVYAALASGDSGSRAAPFWETVFSKMLLRVKMKYKLC